MLSRIRRQLHVLAASVLVLVSAMGAWSTFAHGLDCHDPDGAPVVVVHDASAHAFHSAVPADSERPIHCVLCHCTRVLGSGVQSVAAAPSSLTRTLLVPASDEAVARRLAAAQPPLRAPPVPTLDVVA